MTLTCLSGPAGHLETLAEGFDAPGIAGIAIVCHPHPLFGGTLNNKVVHYTARTLRELGLATLRFNFRGVGQSSGEYDHGQGETDDLLAVIDQVRNQYPTLPLWLAGFSFGGYVALRAAGLTAVQRLITIAPPVARFDFTALPPPAYPWLLLQGEADDIAPAADVRRWLATLTEVPVTLFLPDVGHYFHGRLPLLRQTLLDQLGQG